MKLADFILFRAISPESGGGDSGGVTYTGVGYVAYNAGKDYDMTYGVPLLTSATPPLPEEIINPKLVGKTQFGLGAAKLNVLVQADNFYILATDDGITICAFVRGTFEEDGIVLDEGIYALPREEMSEWCVLWDEV